MIFEESLVLSGSFDDVVPLVKEAFAAEGFGTLSEIDVQATLLGAIDELIEPYVILGMCNPELASRALATVPEIGVLLPCNVVVRETEYGVAVDAMDPALMPEIAGVPELAPLADDARERINRAFTQLAEHARP